MITKINLPNKFFLKHFDDNFSLYVFCYFFLFLGIFIKSEFAIISAFTVVSVICGIIVLTGLGVDLSLKGVMDDDMDIYFHMGGIFLPFSMALIAAIFSQEETSSLVSGTTSLSLPILFALLTLPATLLLLFAEAKRAFHDYVQGN